MAVSPLAAALGGKCPRCGRGRLFCGFLNVVDRCAVCGLALAKHDAGDGPAVFLVLIIGALAVPVALWAEATLGLPDWAPVAIGGLVAVLLVGLLLRPAKAYLVALQFRHRREEYEAD